MLSHFGERGYPMWVLRKAVEKLKLVTREVTLQNKITVPEGETNTARVILTYNNDSQEVHKILAKNWDMLTKDPVIGNSIPSRPMITYRRGLNLRDTLMHNDITSKGQSNSMNLKGFFPCSHCKACRNSIMTKEYNNPNKGTKISINQFLTCSSVFVVYVLECPCNMRYVGSTKHMVTNHVLEHMQAIVNRILTTR